MSCDFYPRARVRVSHPTIPSTYAPVSRSCLKVSCTDCSILIETSFLKFSRSFPENKRVLTSWELGSARGFSETHNTRVGVLFLLIPTRQIFTRNRNRSLMPASRVKTIVYLAVIRKRLYYLCCVCDSHNVF